MLDKWLYFCQANIIVTTIDVPTPAPQPQPNLPMVRFLTSFNFSFRQFFLKINKELVTF
jgi:hypothetical protein